MPSGDRYVAFVDLLGFSELVTRDWDNAEKKYKQFIDLLDTVHRGAIESKKSRGDAVTSDPDLVIASDSVMVVGEHLPQVLDMVQQVQTAALLGIGMLVRGCIAFGKHAHSSAANRHSVVSVPLVLAVEGEKRAHHPRVILDRASGVEASAHSLWREGLPRMLECDDGLLMVQPFTLWNEFDLAYYEKELDRLAAPYKKTKHAQKWDWMCSVVPRVATLLDELRELGEELEGERRHEEGHWEDDLKS